MGATFEQLALRCEAASLGDYAWPQLLQDIAEWIGGSKAMLLGMPDSGPYRHALDWNHDPVAIERYDTHYNRYDPRAGLSRRTPVHQTQLGQQYVRNEDVEDTEYFEAINRFGDVRDSVHGIIGDDAEFGRQSISVQRGFGEDLFEKTEAERLRALLPLLETALRNSMRVARMLGSHRSDGNAACHVVDRNLELRLSDGSEPAAGHASLSSGLISRNRIETADRARHALLEAAVRRALEGETVRFQIGGSAVEVSPLPPPLRWIGEDCVFLVISRARDELRSRADLFAAAHALTERERSVLEALMRQPNMRRAAQDAGISYETMRWHVKNMGQKTHHSRREAMIQAAVTGTFADPSR